MTSQDACLLTKSLVKVQHKTKESASPSEIYFAVLRQNEVPVSIKAFLNPDAVDDDDDRQALGGLVYEIQVYEQIISKILDQKYSPNFIGFVAAGECTPDSDSFVADAFKELKGSKDDKLVNLLMTPLAGGGKNPITTLAELYPQLGPTDQLEVMFQIIYSLRVMNLMRLVHNDLHSSNILVEVLPEPTTRFYRVPKRGGQEKVFTIRTKYVPLIFDWDLAYAEQLGKNPKIEDPGYCLDMNICNRFSAKTDLYTLLCTMDFPAPLGDQYETKVAQFKEREAPIQITPDIAQALKDNPQFLRGNEYFQMSGRQLDELSGGKLAPWIEKWGPNSSLLFTLTTRVNKGKRRHFIQLQFGFHCRPTSFSPDMPTPEALLISPIFNLLEAGKGKNQVPGESPGPVYTLPAEPNVGKLIGSKSTKSTPPPRRIFIDPFRATTRGKISPKQTNAAEIAKERAEAKFLDALEQLLETESCEDQAVAFRTAPLVFKKTSPRLEILQEKHRQRCRKTYVPAAWTLSPEDYANSTTNLQKLN